jgi:hypothetical protein
MRFDRASEQEAMRHSLIWFDIGNLLVHFRHSSRTGRRTARTSEVLAAIERLVGFFGRACLYPIISTSRNFAPIDVPFAPDPHLMPANSAGRPLARAMISTAFELAPIVQGGAPRFPSDFCSGSLPRRRAYAARPSGSGRDTVEAPSPAAKGERTVRFLFALRSIRYM